MYCNSVIKRKPLKNTLTFVFHCIVPGVLSKPSTRHKPGRYVCHLRNSANQMELYLFKQEVNLKTVTTVAKTKAPTRRDVINSLFNFNLY